MGTTLMGVNGVCVGVDTLVVAGGPLHGDLDRKTLLFVLSLDSNDVIVDSFNLFG